MANGSLKVGGFSNLWNKWTGRGTTAAQEEVNAFNANEAQKARDFEEQMSNTAYQRQLADMEAAGVNPALAMGAAANGASTPSGAQAQAAGDPTGGLSMSDLVSTLMAPLSVVQGLKNIKETEANIEKTEAEKRNIDQRTETEKYNTIIYRINSEFQGEMNYADLRNKIQNYNNMVADENYKVASTNYVNSQNEAQKILNEYLPSQQKAILDKTLAEIGKIGAEEAKIRAEKAYQDWYNNFVHSNGFLPSSNDALMIATYVAELFGIAKGDVSDFIDRLIEKVKDAFTNGRGRGKGGDTSPEGGNGSSGGDTSAGSR